MHVDAFTHWHCSTLALGYKQNQVYKEVWTETLSRRLKIKKQGNRPEPGTKPVCICWNKYARRNRVKEVWSNSHRYLVHSTRIIERKSNTSRTKKSQIRNVEWCLEVSSSSWWHFLSTYLCPGCMTRTSRQSIQGNITPEKANYKYILTMMRIWWEYNMILHGKWLG